MVEAEAREATHGGGLRRPGLALLGVLEEQRQRRRVAVIAQGFEQEREDVRVLLLLRAGEEGLRDLGVVDAGEHLGAHTAHGRHLALESLDHRGHGTWRAQEAQLLEDDLAHVGVQLLVLEEAEHGLHRLAVALTAEHAGQGHAHGDVHRSHGGQRHRPLARLRSSDLREVFDRGALELRVAVFRRHEHEVDGRTTLEVARAVDVGRVAHGRRAVVAHEIEDALPTLRGVEERQVPRRTADRAAVR